MPSKTYIPLATTTVSGSSTTQISFSSISGSYTDLVLVAEMAPMPSVTAIRFRFNGDSGSNYGYIQLAGSGAAASSSSDTSQTSGLVSGAISNTTNRAMFIMNIMNYSNATTYKTTVNRGSRSIDTSYASTSLCTSTWRSTSAITQVAVTPSFGNDIVIPAGSMFTLYGIASA
jgi:hypothetical protein